jgi:hypothetical protein
MSDGIVVNLIHKIPQLCQLIREAENFQNKFGGSAASKIFSGIVQDYSDESISSGSYNLQWYDTYF